jgi:hypothetical protein
MPGLLAFGSFYDLVAPFSGGRMFPGGTRLHGGAHGFSPMHGCPRRLLVPTSEACMAPPRRRALKGGPAPRQTRTLQWDHPVARSIPEALDRPQGCDTQSRPTSLPGDRLWTQPIWVHKIGHPEGCPVVSASVARAGRGWRKRSPRGRKENLFPTPQARPTASFLKGKEE